MDDMVFSLTVSVLLLVMLIVLNVFVKKIWSAERPDGTPDVAKVAQRKLATTTTNVVLASILVATTWTGVMYYADPGYMYQVRMLSGDVVGHNTPGWHVKLYGTVVPWKKAMSVSHKVANENSEESVSSANLPYRIRMLDRVDGLVEQTTRFRLPEDITSFLKMAEEYRTPENLMVTELVPVVEQVITASSSLMSAEDYFNGRRNDFQLDYDYQMREGIFLVNRQEKRRSNETPRKSTADASKGSSQANYGDQEQTYFEVQKLQNADGTYKTRDHNYKAFGIRVVDAKITDFDPNDDFKKRMKDQQKASADRSIAREQRIQEEEQKQLAIVMGERKIAEEQAVVQKDQIKRTTAAETEKSLALIKASKLLEQAEIEKQTAIINLERDTTVAKSQVVLANADKFAREARISGDNALEQKLAAEMAIQGYWADAFAKRSVPSTVFITGNGAGGSDVSTGSNSELTQMLNIMTMQMGQNLDYNRGINISAKTK